MAADTASVLLGAGAYSNTYCNADKYWGKNGVTNEAFISKCILAAHETSASGAANTVVSLYNCHNTATSSIELHVPNAVEMTWTMPYGVPSDRTEVAIDCATNAGVASATTNYGTSG